MWRHYMIFLAGMGSVDPATGGRNLGPTAEQIRRTLRNMRHMLESAGSNLDRVFLSDVDDCDGINRVWQLIFPRQPTGPHCPRAAAEQRQRR
jgi:enamine deaminase RidA (YjgF/YER057c/UK114 family)